MESVILWENSAVIEMGSGYISVITAISFILPAMQGKRLIILCRDPPPPQRSIWRDSLFPGYVIQSCGVNLRTRTSPRSHPATPPDPLFPESTRTLRSLSMPQQKLLLTSVLNTPEDLRSVGTDRTSKQPFKRFTGENMLYLPRGGG